MVALTVIVTVVVVIAAVIVTMVAEGDLTTGEGALNVVSRGILLGNVHLVKGLLMTNMTVAGNMVGVVEVAIIMVLIAMVIVMVGATEMEVMVAGMEVIVMVVIAQAHINDLVQGAIVLSCLHMLLWNSGRIPESYYRCLSLEMVYLSQTGGQ
ncbi:hypothetical protein EJ110_NYTH15836 [Nymphaea thermarum]|nr:hypothetical protein EJ110_NYTH15836 [Nymphaea thermarum]